MKWAFYLLLLANAVFFSWRMRSLEPPPPAAVVAAEIPGRVNSLLLLSEVDAAELRERIPASEPAPVRTAAGDTVPAKPVPAADGGVCFSVGPLNDEEQVTRVRQWLEERSGRTTLRARERRELARYWVYFPPFLSRDAARARENEMRARGLDDIYIILRGDMANAISLGVYSRRASLDRRLADLKERGYEPSVVPRYRTTKASWFDVEFPAGYVFPEGEFAAAFPDAEATGAACARPGSGSAREAGPGSDPDPGTSDRAAAAPSRSVPLPPPAGAL